MSEVSEQTQKLRDKYGKSAQGNFLAWDSIGVPHPYCITPRHVAEASDRFGGILGEEAIKAAEANGAVCDICRKNGQILTFDQHEKALLVKCLLDPNKDETAKEELNTFLQSIVEKATQDGFAGFAFMQ